MIPGRDWQHDFLDRAQLWLPKCSQAEIASFNSALSVYNVSAPYVLFIKGEDLMKKLAILLVSLMTAFTSYVPAQAFPTAGTSTPTVATDVQQVQYRDERRYVPRDRRYNGRYDRRDRFDRRDRYSNRGYDRHDRYGRRHNNTGAIIGGLAAGAIIGGAIASQNRGSNSCASRYRSYRASDNTYQPSSGPRRVCP
jgi:hypothetical protein